MPFNSDNTYRDPRQRLQSSAYAPTNQGGPGNPGTANNMPQNQQRPDPFNQYGYSGQSPSLGRYVPPMLNDRNNLQSWGQQGGYAYNIPNSYGNPQYNQFNSGGMSNPGFGQSQNTPPPMPQLAPAQRELMTMFSGLPGMSSVTDPYREQLRPPMPQMNANYGMEQTQPTGVSEQFTNIFNQLNGQPQGKPVSQDAYAGYSRPGGRNISPGGQGMTGAEAAQFMNMSPEQWGSVVEQMQGMQSFFNGQKPGASDQYGQNRAKPVGLGMDSVHSRPPVPGMSYPMGPDGKALRTSDQDGYGGQEENENGMGGNTDKNRFTEWFSDKFPRATQFVRNEMDPNNRTIDLGNMMPGAGMFGAIGNFFNRPRGGAGSPPMPGDPTGGPRPMGGQMGPNQPYTVPTYGGSSGGAQWPGNQEYFRPMPEQDRGPQQPYTVPTYGGAGSPPVPRPMPSSNRGRSSASLNAMRGEMSDDRIRNAVADMRAHEWRGRS